MILPKHVSKNAPKGRLLSESEWRGLGVQQSRGWVHYAIHRHAAHHLTAARAWRAARPHVCPNARARALTHARARRPPPESARPLSVWTSHARLQMPQATHPRRALTRACRRHTLCCGSPEPHILLFRRPQGTDPTTGLVHGKRIDPQTGKVCA